MPVGLGEISLHVGVASVTEFRRRLRQQILRLLGMMRRMAIKAAYIAVRMRRRRVMRLPFLVSVTSEAARAGLFARQLFETYDFGDIRIRSMRRSRPVTGFAAMTALKRCLVVGGLVETSFVEFFV